MRAFWKFFWGVSFVAGLLCLLQGIAHAATPITRGAAAKPLARHDPNWPKVQLLLHGFGVTGGTSFPDSSVGAHTITPTGATTTATTQFFSAIDTTAASGNHVLSSSVQAIGTGDFTVELWGFFNTASCSSFFSSLSTSTDTIIGHWLLGVCSGLTIFYDGSAGTIVNAGSVSTGAWHHVAAARQSGTLRLFLDGTQVGSGTYTANIPANTYSVGSDNDGTNYTPGYFHDVRLTIGVARYTAAFTPSTVPFPNR